MFELNSFVQSEFFGTMRLQVVRFSFENDLFHGGMHFVFLQNFKKMQFIIKRNVFFSLEDNSDVAYIRETAFDVVYNRSELIH